MASPGAAEEWENLSMEAAACCFSETDVALILPEGNGKLGMARRELQLNSWLPLLGPLESKVLVETGTFGVLFVQSSAHGGVVWLLHSDCPKDMGLGIPQS